MSGLKADTPTENREFIKLALDYNVLSRVDVWHKHSEEGDPAIVIACGDMHQVKDRMQHCWERFSPMAQLITLNGAGVRLDGLSPANQPRNYVPYVRDLVEEAIRTKEQQLNRDRIANVTRLEESIRLKQEELTSAPAAAVDQIEVDIMLLEEERKRYETPSRVDRIVLYVDSNCGVANAHGLSVQQSIRLAINGKQYLKDMFPGRTVVLKFYLDKPAELLGPDHPIVAKNPGAQALTFYFSSKAMLDFFDIFQRDHAPALTA